MEFGYEFKEKKVSPVPLFILKIKEIFDVLSLEERKIIEEYEKEEGSLEKTDSDIY